MVVPNWYKDPDDPSMARWHDGKSFTDHRVRMADYPAGATPPPPPTYQAPELPVEPSPAVASTRAQNERWKPWRSRWAIAAVVLVVLAAGGAIASFATSGGGESSNASTPRAEPDAAALLPDPTTEATVTDPTPADFRIDVVVTSKHCFGSAGCNLEYDVDLTYAGTTPLDPDGTWTLIYEVDGGKDGPQIENLTLTGDGKATVPQDESISTSSGSAVLTAHVTSVR
jgi:hypothetical protein